MWVRASRTQQDPLMGQSRPAVVTSAIVISAVVLALLHRLPVQQEGPLVMFPKLSRKGRLPRMAAA